jgi:hypothetical protein
MDFPVAERSLAGVCGRSLAGIAGLNPAGGDECPSLVSCVLSGRGLPLVERSPADCGVWGGVCVCVTDCDKVQK